MKKIIKIKLVAIIYLSITIYSCKKNEKTVLNKSVIKEITKDSLKLIKDTIIFTESSEGQEIQLFLDSNTKDSIIINENYGETGKEYYKFIFNKNLIDAENKITEYVEPISVNPNPVIKKENTKTLKSPDALKNGLLNTYKKFRKIFIIEKNNKKNILNNKWIGNYNFSINQNSEDWRDVQDVSLKISNDSIIYKVEGYQIYQLYKLNAIEKNNILKLVFEKTLDNTESEVLKKTIDFGEIKLENNKYTWKCPYVDLSFNNDKSQIYKLQKK